MTTITAAKLVSSCTTTPLHPSSFPNHPISHNSSLQHATSPSSPKFHHFPLPLEVKGGSAALTSYLFMPFPRLPHFLTKNNTVLNQNLYHLFKPSKNQHTLRNNKSPTPSQTTSLTTTQTQMTTFQASHMTLIHLTLTPTPTMMMTTISRLPFQHQQPPSQLPLQMNYQIKGGQHPHIKGGHHQHHLLHRHLPFAQPTTFPLPQILPPLHYQYQIHQPLQPRHPNSAPRIELAPQFPRIYPSPPNTFKNAPVFVISPISSTK